MSRKLLIALVGVLALTAVAVPAASAKKKKEGRQYYLAHHAPTAAPKPGNVITVHGGGWAGDLGARADEVMESYIADTRAWGYDTYNVGYRSGRNSLRDVVDAVRRVVKKNPGEPLCLVGGSAGAHLALIAAIRKRRDIDCVVDIGGPPDLVNPDNRPLSTLVRDLAGAAFGTLSRLLRLSPINRANEIRQPVLVVAPDCDSFTSFERQAAFAAALRRGELVRVAGKKRNVISDLLERLGLSFFDFGFGSEPGVDTGHCEVTRRSFDEFRMAERAFLARHLG